MDKTIYELEQELYNNGADSSDLQLYDAHTGRPCYVCKNGSIYVETWHGKISDAAIAFLLAIAEPVSRPQMVHHYRLTAYSILASVSLGTKNILQTLQNISKNVLSNSVMRFVSFFVSSYGRINLVIRRRRIFIESTDSDLLIDLLKNERIRSARIDYTKLSAKRERLDNTPEGEYEPQDDATTRFEIDPRMLNVVKRETLEMGLPMLEEYDYQNDNINQELELTIRDKVEYRYYQREALSKMFHESRARSGIIVLPCGAGKTLTGISAACTIRKSTIVLCSNTNACKQWIEQFNHFTVIAPNNLLEFTSGVRPVFPKDGSAVVLATTYSMMAFDDECRSSEGMEAIKDIRSREWGLVILDEVHMAPADSFRRCLGEVKAHCKLGLTATLVREDDHIGDLNFLVGPKLYEADWTTLTEMGYLSKVLCSEVVCPMSAAYLHAYIYEQSRDRRNLLAVMNPRKFNTCKFLMESHESDGHKILIYTDSIASVEMYGIALKRYFMHGKVSIEERETLLKRFRMPTGTIDPVTKLTAISTLILSKIGDVALDLPDASVIIQVSSHYGSRRQEAQRLGRILRPKTSFVAKGYNAVFYSLVSADTIESTHYGPKRRQYVIDQGYTYTTILPEDLKGMPKVKEDYMEDTVNIEKMYAQYSDVKFD